MRFNKVTATKSLGLWEKSSRGSRMAFFHWIWFGLLCVVCAEFGVVFAQDSVSCKPVLVRIWSAKSENQKQLRSPGGLCCDPEGTVYVADTGNHRVVVFDSQGKLVKEIGGMGVGAYQFNRPSDVTAKLGLDLLVADAGNDRIQRFNRRLGYISTVNNDRVFTEPMSLDVSSFGDFFVLDGDRRLLVKIDALTGLVVTFGGIGSGPGELQDPKDVDVGRGESVWVADGVSGKVIQFDLFGNYMAGYFLGDGVDVRGVAAGENGVWIAAKDRLGYLNQRGKLQWCLGKDDLQGMKLASIDDVAIFRDGLVVLDAVGGKVAWFAVERKATR